MVVVLVSWGVLVRATNPEGWIRVMSKVALKDGSSKHGKALLACVAWNWLVAIQLKEYYF